jgi:hypothetical protein
VLQGKRLDLGDLERTGFRFLLHRDGVPLDSKATDCDTGKAGCSRPVKKLSAFQSWFEHVVLLNHLKF